MRDPGRIDRFLPRLRELWHEHSDQRFGQLIMNLSRTPDGFADIWEWDVPEFESRIRRFRMLYDPVSEKDNTP